MSSQVKMLSTIINFKDKDSENTNQGIFMYFNVYTIYFLRLGEILSWKNFCVSRVCVQNKIRNNCCKLLIQGNLVSARWVLILWKVNSIEVYRFSIFTVFIFKTVLSISKGAYIWKIRLVIMKLWTNMLFRNRKKWAFFQRIYYYKFYSAWNKIL